MMTKSASMKQSNTAGLDSVVLEAVAGLVQRQTALYAERRKAIAIAAMTGKHSVIAGQQDAWDVAWDCNTDACEIEDLYRRNGKSQAILKRVLEHPHATPNAIRAVCYLLWRDHGKHTKPEIATMAYTQFKYIKNDQTWIRELARVGNIRAALEVELDHMKAIMHDCGDLGDVLEEANRALGIREQPGQRCMVAAQEVVAAHKHTGASVEIIIAHSARGSQKGGI